MSNLLELLELESQELAFAFKKASVEGKGLHFSPLARMKTPGSSLKQESGISQAKRFAISQSGVVSLFSLEKTSLTK